MPTIQERLAKLIAHQLAVSETDVLPDTKFADLGADSLDQVELVMAVEDEFKVEITDQEAEGINTPAGFVEILAKRAATV